AAPAGDPEALVAAEEINAVDDGLVMELYVGVAAGGEGVGAHGQAVALPERVAGDALDGLRAGPARQPDHPRVGGLFREGGELADGGGRRVAAADDKDVFPGVNGLAAAEHVFQAVDDVRLGRRLAHRGDAAVAQPTVLAVRPRAVQDHVGL